MVFTVYWNTTLACSDYHSHCAEKECLRRRSLAVSALELRAGTNHDKLTISSSGLSYGAEHDARRITFVVMQCASSSGLKVGSIKINAPFAVKCSAKCPLFADCGDAVVVHGRRLRGSDSDKCVFH